METSPMIRRTLRDSVEFYSVLRDLIVYTVAGIVFALVIRLRYSEHVEGSFRTTIVVWCVLFLTPVWVFGIVRMWRIFRKSGGYRLFSCKLDTPHQRKFLGGIYFTVEVQNANGEPMTVSTRAIFRAHGIMGPLLTEYQGKTVTIAYNELTHTTIVIG